MVSLQKTEWHRIFPWLISQYPSFLRSIVLYRTHAFPNYLGCVILDECLSFLLKWWILYSHDDVQKDASLISVCTRSLTDECTSTTMILSLFHLSTVWKLHKPVVKTVKLELSCAENIDIVHSCITMVSFRDNFHLRHNNAIIHALINKVQKRNYRYSITSCWYC